MDGSDDTDGEDDDEDDEEDEALLLDICGSSSDAESIQQRDECIAE